MESKIKSVRAADGGARLLLTVETQKEGETGRETEVLTLLATRLTSLPETGMIDGETLAYYRAESEIAAALTAGLRSLGAAACSARRLAQKLRAKGFATDAAEIAVAELTARGMLDECRAAVREAERGMEKGWGDRRILADLAAKGYGKQAQCAARARLAEENGAARCRALIRRRRLAAPRDSAEAKKLFAALARYGYSPAEIRAALSEKEHDS